MSRQINRTEGYVIIYHTCGNERNPIVKVSKTVLGGVKVERRNGQARFYGKRVAARMWNAATFINRD